ncbi:MAG: hypothetical protein WKG07_34700 [Hymenobacter sp.]
MKRTTTVFMALLAASQLAAAQTTAPGAAPTPAPTPSRQLRRSAPSRRA